MFLNTAQKYVKAFLCFVFFCCLLNSPVFSNEYFQNRDNPSWLMDVGVLSVGIFDFSNGEPVFNPVIRFNEGYFSNDVTVSNGVLGTQEETIRVANNSSNPAWSLTLAAEDIDAKWESVNDSYFFNHPDDENLGRLTVNPQNANFLSNCDDSSLSVGDVATFQRGVVDNVDLVNSYRETPYYCTFDILNILLSQVIPASQPVGVYDLPMVLTVTVVPVEPFEPLNLNAFASDSNIILEWDAPESDGGAPIVGYMVERYESDWEVLVENTETTGAYYIDNATQFGIVYGYRVTAINSIGLGDPSDVEEAFMVYTVEYNPSLGGNVIPTYQQVGLASNVDPPTIIVDEDYSFVDFHIISGEGNGNLDPVTGVVYDVVGNMVIGVNFVYDPVFEIVQLAAGNSHSLALDSRGNVWAWGSNEFGQLGNGTYNDNYEPSSVMTELGDLSNIAFVYAGGDHNLAIDNYGNVWAWGSNEFGQLGDGTTIDRYFPVQVVNGGGYLEDISVVVAGGHHSLALSITGELYSWGRNESGQLGDNSTTNRASPVRVVGGQQGGIYLENIGIVVAGENHTVALDSQGRTWSWGNNDFRQLGDGTGADRRAPTRVRGAQQGNAVLENVVSISSGYNHSFALEQVPGDLRAWGSNSYGQLGDNTTAERSIPIRVLSGEQGGGTYLSNIASFYGGRWHSVMLDNGGNVWAWGSNHFGQLGDDQVSGQQVLTPIETSLIDIQQIAVGASHNLALDDYGNVWVWGLNVSGQLGDGTQIDSHIPIQIDF